MHAVHVRTPRPFVLLCTLLASISFGCRSSSSRAPLGTSTDARSAAVAEAGGPAPMSREVTDARITTAVIRELAEDPAVDATQIRVRTTNGVVELTGTVDNILSKELATRHAEVVKGVRAVANRVTVAGPRVPDAELAQTVEGALRSDPVSNVLGLQVAAKDGAVELRGNVTSFQQRLFAERVAKRIRGVSDVANRLEVKPGRSRTDAQIARDVAARMRWDVLVDDGLVGVDVRNGEVHLHGVVGSAAEKSQAERDAWVVGVKSVDGSRLRVEGWARDERLRRDKYVIKSDDEVAHAIRDALFLDPRVSERDVVVTASGGVATLTGTVPTVAARRAATDIAMHTVGVLSINDHLTVAAPTNVPDAELTQTIEDRLRLDPFTSEHDIDVKAERGRITLAGEVSSHFARAEAEAIAAETRGVRAIANHLSVAPNARPFVQNAYAFPYHPPAATPPNEAPRATKADREIAREIENQLFWSPFVHDDRVTVTVRDGKAKLEGTVDTVREKWEAAKEALEGGATSVDNQLRLP